MANAPPEAREFRVRLARAIARARPEDAPRLAVAALRALFPADRCDLIVRRRTAHGRRWAGISSRGGRPEDLGLDEARLPAEGVARDALGSASGGRPGHAALAREGFRHRLSLVVRAAEVKAVLSVARRAGAAFSDEDGARLASAGALLRAPLITWARFERFRRTLRRARFLQGLLADVGRSLEIPELAVTCLRRIGRHVPADALLLVEPPGSDQELIAWMVPGPDGSPARIRHARPGDARARRAALVAPITRADLTAVAEPGPWESDATEQGFRSLLALPLELRRRHAGAVILLAREAGALGGGHLPLLRHVSRPLASALERACLHRETEERSRQMSALYEVGKALNSPLGTAEVTDRVLSILHDAFRFEHSAVLTLESAPDGDSLVMQASRGYSLGRSTGFRIPVGERGVTSRAVRTGKTVYVPDVRQDADYVEGVHEGRSEVAVPLHVGGRTVGVLDVESTQVNGFSPQELEHLQLLSTQVALALERARLFDDVRRQAMTDSLSGLLNQRYFREKVDRELDRSRRTGRPFALALLDVDDFKRVNDEHGHVAGDQVIASIGEVLRSHVRSIDAAARFGGDEFAMILSEADAAHGARVAEDVRVDLLERKPAGLDVSLSIGVVGWHPGLRDWRDTVGAADVALYRAKALGKGRVVVAAADAPGAGE